MDVLSVATCAGVGAAAWLCAMMLLAPGSSYRPRSSDPLSEFVSALMRSPPFAELSRQSELSRRRAHCLRQMPSLLDIVTLGLSAGLSFDSSLELYCQRSEGELSDAFREAMTSWRIGIQSREKALAALAEELDVSALRRFAAVVTQALSFGAPLAAALEHQAQLIRDEQRSQTEEEMEKVPVKMLIPMGTLIVPAMLLAILGPLLASSLAFA